MYKYQLINNNMLKSLVWLKTIKWIRFMNEFMCLYFMWRKCERPFVFPIPFNRDFLRWMSTSNKCRGFLFFKSMIESNWRSRHSFEKWKKKRWTSLTNIVLSYGCNQQIRSKIISVYSLKAPSWTITSL